MAIFERVRSLFRSKDATAPEPANDKPAAAATVASVVGKHEKILLNAIRSGQDISREQFDLTQLYQFQRTGDFRSPVKETPDQNSIDDGPGDVEARYLSSLKALAVAGNNSEIARSLRRRVFDAETRLRDVYAEPSRGEPSPIPSRAEPSRTTRPSRPQLEVRSRGDHVR